MATHKRIYITPSHTKKIFGNMRRVGKGFSGRVTPLFPTMVVQNQSELGKGSVVPTDPHHMPTFIQPSAQPQKTQQPRKPKRKDTQVPHPSDPTKNVADEAVHKELGDRLVRATASSLEAVQDSSNINKTQSKATPTESNSGDGPGCQEAMGDTIAQTGFESVSKHFNDSLLASGNTFQNDKDILKLDELMALCTTLQSWVLDLEETKTTQQNEIASLKRRVKKLEKKDRKRTHKLKRLYKGRIDAIDIDEEITLVSVHDEMDVDEEVVEVINTTKLIIDAAQDSVSAAITTTATIKTFDDFTLAQALEEMKNIKPKKKGVVIQDLGESTTTTTISSQLPSQQSQDKGKGILVKIDADHQLAERMQAQEQEELSIEEKATLF
ncbi:hypothetical protein Tco_1360524 [Tanacetum coccineum]